MKENKFIINYLLPTQEELSGKIQRTLQRMEIKYQYKAGSYIYIDYGQKTLLTSHLDTVDDHSATQATQDSYSVKDGIVSSIDGKHCVGGDDRAGVAIMMEMIISNNRDYDYVFFFDEEIGGVGSSVFASTFKNTLGAYNSFISLDRRGTDECALYGYDNQQLVDVFTARGYREAYGSFTDCVHLSSVCDVACINLSVGYDNEHSHRETQDLSIIDKVITLLNDEEVVDELNSMAYKAEEYGCNVPYDGANMPVLCECCGEHKPLYDIDGYQVCEDCIDFTEYIHEY